MNALAGSTSSRGTALRALVFEEGSLREFRSLEEAEAAAGGELAHDLRAMLDERCTVLFVDATGDMPEGMARQFAGVPAQHRRSVAAAGIATFQTLSSRNPILVIDVGEQFAMVVAPVDMLQRFILQRYAHEVPLALRPDNYGARCVVSITPSGELLRTELHLAPLPGVAQA